MATITVPTHYEMLGLTPGAGDEEIARAFAKQMSMATSARGFGILIDLMVGDNDHDRDEDAQRRGAALGWDRQRDREEGQHQHHHHLDETKVEVRLGLVTLGFAVRSASVAEPPQLMEVELVGLRPSAPSKLANYGKADGKIVGLERQRARSRESR